MHDTDSHKDLKDWLKLVVLQILIVIVLVGLKFV